MKKNNKNLLYFVILTLFFSICISACKKDNEMEDILQNTGKGTVKITNIVAKRKTTTGLQIEVTVTTSGVEPDEVKTLAVCGGTNKDAEGLLWASLGGGETSGTMKIVAGLQSKKTYYIKAYLKTYDGIVYSPIKKVTTP